MNADQLISVPAISSLIGAFLVFGASFFKDIGIPIQNSQWYKKLLFLLCGYLIGFLLSYKDQHLDPFYAASLGGGWIYVASGFRNASRVFIKAMVVALTAKENVTTKEA